MLADNVNSMIRSSRVRKVARYGGGGLGVAGVVGAAGWGLMWGEAKLAVRRIPKMEAQ